MSVELSISHISPPRAAIDFPMDAEYPMIFSCVPTETERKKDVFILMETFVVPVAWTRAAVVMMSNM